MIQTLIGIKKNMTSTYDSRGRRVGATILEVLPNLMTQVKTSEGKDGYNSVQLGTGTKKSVKKPQIGHAKKAGSEAKIRWFRETKTDAAEDIKPGTQVSVAQVFSVGDIVKVTGKSKGKGFAGSVKRHGFHGGPKTHGQSDRHRAPGSIGSGTTPGRVYKGKKMAGHMGNIGASILNLEVVSIDKTKGQLTVKGGVPGPVGGMLMITRLGRVKGYTPPPEEKVDEEEQESAVSSQPSENTEAPQEVKEEKAEEATEDKQNA